MRYLLRKIVLGEVPEIDITEEQYSEYENARRVLSNCLAIEEKYEIVISNYIDFEKQILDTTISYMVRQDLNYSIFFNVRISFNIRLANLLASVRLYKDQLVHNVYNCLPREKNVKDLVMKLFKKEYDEHWEFRFMEALRNHVQHRGIPVHLTQYGGRWISLENDGLLEYSIEVASLRSSLGKEGKFKKSVLDEIGEKIDLKAVTRCYIECISNVHCAVREMIEDSANTSRKLLEDAHKKYSELFDQSLAGLSACAWSDGKQVSSVPLMLDWDDIRLQLIQRNRKLTNLRKRYITGQIKADNK